MPSYGSDAGLIAYLAETGRVLPVAAVPAQVRAVGTLYVDSFEPCYRGVAVSTDNSFPRDLWPVVPTRVEYATYEAAYASANGVALFGTGGTAGGQVTREKVDVIEVEYAGPQEGQGWWESNMFILPQAYALLLPFFKRKGGLGYAAFIV